MISAHGVAGPNMLAEQHAHEFDSRLDFDGPTHSYMLDGTLPCTSVTTVVANAFPKFDPAAAIATMKTGRRWDPAHPLFAMSDKDIMDKWKQTGTEAAHAGTALHEHLDSILNLPGELWKDAVAESVAAGSPVELQTCALPFLQTMLKDGGRPYRTEWRIFSAADRVAGTVDALVQEADGTFTLYDWKRSSSIKWDNHYETALPPLRHIPNSKLAKYSLQLNLYRHLLEQQMRIPVARMRVVAFHPDLPHGCHVYPVDRMEKETAELLKMRRALLKSK